MRQRQRGSCGVENATTCMGTGAYHRLRLNPPPLRDPPPPFRPPPNPAGLAISTFSVRPSSSWPLNFLTAASASSALAISTKPNPRERPVSRSVTTVADSTPPAAAKSSRRPSSVVAKDNPPINSLFANGLTSFEGCVDSGSPYITYILYYSSTICLLIYKSEAEDEVIPRGEASTAGLPVGTSD